MAGNEAAAAAIEAMAELELLPEQKVLHLANETAREAAKQHGATVHPRVAALRAARSP